MFIALQCSGLFYTLFMISRKTKIFQALAGLLVFFETKLASETYVNTIGSNIGKCDVVIMTVESQREMKSGEGGRRQKERRHHREMTLNDMC